MAKNLLIVESPAKAKTLKKFLGKDFAIEASYGHIIDLPTKKTGIDIEGGFVPEYVPIKGKDKVIEKIRKKAAAAETVYLSPDPDREGEAIAWHLAKVVQALDNPPKLLRAVFNEITPKAVRSAVENPRGLNEDLFDSQQARRVLDRLVGYQISPILWRKVRRGLSAGRVQSVALRIIVERDLEIQKFVPVEYWSAHAAVKHTNGEFEMNLTAVDGEKPALANEEDANAVKARAEASTTWEITSVETKERKRKPAPPFITSTLQQDAASKMRYTAKRTMQVAQQLYEGIELGDEGAVGLITYMRTDSVRLSDDAIEGGRAWISQEFGDNYLPAKPRQFKARKGSQDAHEAIRPTYLDKSPESIKQYLSDEQMALYSLIWNRFVASQMAEAIFDQTAIEVNQDGLTWRATGSVLKFDGFLRTYRTDADDDDKQSLLPAVSKGENLAVQELRCDQHFTQPPAHFNEASLIRYLEEKGIGRPSTYAAILSTLTEKNYVERVGRKLIATALGHTVGILLAEAFPTIMDVDFTAGLENQLDEVEAGELKYLDLMQGFYTKFEATLADAEKNMPDVRAQGVATGLTCPKCGEAEGGEVRIKLGKSGEFLACNRYPDCDYSSDFERQEDGTVQAVEKKKEEEIVVGKCTECEEGNLIVKRARRGNRFIACNQYPKCKNAGPFEIGIKCPDCETGQLVEKAGPRKLFFGCSSYPDCKHVSWNKPVARPCPACNYSYVTEYITKKAGAQIKCPSCNHTEPAPELLSVEES